MFENGKRPTISDIAAAAGVSKTTLSRYLNGRKDLMSKATWERIDKVVRVSNYQPNDSARNLKKKKTNLIGVIVSDMSSPFSSTLIGSIDNLLMERGYTPLFADSQTNLEKEQNLIDVFLSKGVAGLLVNTTSYSNDYLIATACKGIPVVLCDRYVKNYNFDIVTMENARAIHGLVVHWKEQGYTRPFMFTQRWLNNSSRSIRRECFIQSVKEVYGYDPSDDIYTVSRIEENSALTQLQTMQASLRSGDIPVIFCVNSLTTVLTYKAIRAMDLRIPQEIGICGPEDWGWNKNMAWPTLLEPCITTYSCPVHNMGYRAAERLLELLDHPDSAPQEIKLPCEIHVRASTDRLSLI